MIRRLFFAAIAAGALAGVIISAVYQFTTVPIILHAETFETAAETAPAPAVASGRWFQPARLDLGQHPPPTPLLRPVHGTETHDGESAWAPEDGFERMIYTTLTAVLTGVGFGLLLVAGMALRGEAVDARRGVLWGAGGFVAFTLAPAFGLPPEIPGAAAADLVSRQGWWIAAAVTAAVGLWLLVFSETVLLKALGVVIALVAHVIGAPHPQELGTGGAPAELAAQFAATTIVVSALFWVLLGGFAGHFFGRSAPETHP